MDGALTVCEEYDQPTIQPGQAEALARHLREVAAASAEACAAREEDDEQAG